jgi:hypothetical protein
MPDTRRSQGAQHFAQLRPCQSRRTPRDGGKLVQDLRAEHAARAEQRLDASAFRASVERR